MSRVFKKIFVEVFGKDDVKLLSSGDEVKTSVTGAKSDMEKAVGDCTPNTTVSTKQTSNPITEQSHKLLLESTVEQPLEQPSEQPKEKIKTPRKIVRICKIGSDHTFANMNNHDFAFNLLNMKIVTDGCGSGKHSEVGTKLFAQLFARKAKEYHDRGEAISEENFVHVVNEIFEKMLGLCDDFKFIEANYLFTILACFEFEEEFVVFSCGDGYIIKENAEGITFEEIDQGEAPGYYAYNFVEDKSVLNAYQDGVSFKVNRYSKQEFSNVGVATDGLRYFEKLLDVEKAKMLQFLHDGKGPQIEILINRNNRKNEVFHDDISICF